MSYSSSLTDAQSDARWALIEDYSPQGNYGNRAKYSKCLVVDAVLYISKTGYQ